MCFAAIFSNWMLNYTNLYTVTLVLGVVYLNSLDKNGHLFLESEGKPVLVEGASLFLILLFISAGRQWLSARKVCFSCTPPPFSV